MAKSPHELTLSFANSNCDLSFSHRSLDTQTDKTSGDHGLGWSNRDSCKFFALHLSSLACQLTDLENHLIAEPSGARDLRRGYSVQRDPVMRTRQMLKQMEHARRLLGLSQTLEQAPVISNFDLQALINEAKENTCPIDQIIDYQNNKPLMVFGDQQQIYLAISCLMFELSQKSFEISVSYVSKGEQWELEFADTRDEIHEDSVAIRTGRIVARNHGGELMIDPCPQGGHAFNFVFPVKSSKKAA